MSRELERLHDALLAKELNPGSAAIRATVEKLKTACIAKGIRVPRVGILRRIELGLATIPDLRKAVMKGDRETAGAAWKVLDSQHPAMAAEIRKAIRVRRTAIGAVLLVLLASGAGAIYNFNLPANREQREWAKVTAVSSVESLEAFLSHWPNGRHAARAKERLEAAKDQAAEAEWKRISSGEDISALRAYLGRTPNGKHAKEAEERIDDLAWAIASKRNTNVSIAIYMREHPNGKHLQEAKEWERADELDRAMRSRSAKALESFLAKYPEGAQAKRAQTALAEMLKPWVGAWEDSNDKIVHVIELKNGTPSVSSVIEEQRVALEVSDVSWNDGVLTWAYSRRETNGSISKITFRTTGQPAGRLSCEWRGQSRGLVTLQKMSPNQRSLFESAYAANLRNPRPAQTVAVPSRGVESPVAGAMTTTASGLKYRIIRDAKGPKPTLSSTVRVHYRGSLVTGAVFDSSYARGVPAEMRLRALIAGFAEGLQLMSVGSKYEFRIPPELGYGRKAPPQIGPDQTLLFEVELLAILRSAN